MTLKTKEYKPLPILPKTRFDEYSLHSERDTVSIALGAYANPDGTEILYARISHSVFESLNERFLIPESREFTTTENHPTPRG